MLNWSIYTYLCLQKCPSYVYCPLCDKAWPGWDMNLYKQHPHHTGIPIDFPGVNIQVRIIFLFLI